VDLRNDGASAAEETVFLFSRDKLASVARPLLELRAFAKITLQPGRSGTVRLAFDAAALRFLGPDLRSVFEPGEVEILAGPCADRARLLGTTIQLFA
jgi:beta-glucosidase